MFKSISTRRIKPTSKSFNPLNRVKFVQMGLNTQLANGSTPFQSPKSGQICSNTEPETPIVSEKEKEFQSPKSGQICSNKSLPTLQV